MRGHATVKTTAADRSCALWKRRAARWTDSFLRQVPRLVMVATLAVLTAASATAAPVYVVSGAPDDGRGIVYYGTNTGEERSTWWGGQRLVHVSPDPSFVSYDEIGVFCMEPYEWLPFEFEPLAYNVGSLDDFGLNALQQQRIQLLVDNAYSVLSDDDHPFHFSVRATAFQVALWEILNDGATAAPLDLTADLTRVDVEPGDYAEIHEMFSLANGWINHLNNGDWTTTGQYEFRMLLSDEWQDLGFVVPVPEPTSFALAGLALVGVCLFRRRRA